MNLRLRSGLVALALATTLAACTDEPTTDLEFGTTTTAAPSTVAPEDDPNAAARAQIQELAEQECIDHPERDEGVIQIADPETGDVLSEYRINCETLEPITDAPLGVPQEQG